MINPDSELRFKRLQYRSLHRGCKETDLIFGRFAQSALMALSPALLAAYERLLEESDADIWDWLTGKSPAPAQYEELLAMLEASRV